MFVKIDRINLKLTDYKILSIETAMYGFPRLCMYYTKFEVDMGKVIVSGHICTVENVPNYIHGISERCSTSLISDELQRIRELISTISFSLRCALMQNARAT